MERRLAAIFVIDVVGYSGLMEHDEVSTHNRLRELRSTLFLPTVNEYRGRVVKLTGDGALVLFPSVVDAVDCGIRFQTEMAARNAACNEADRLQLRIGINLGDVMIDGRDIYGNDVNVAARLEALSDAGGLCISDTAYQYISSEVKSEFESIGEQAVKNIRRLIGAWRWTGKVSRRETVNSNVSPRSSSGKSSLAVLPFLNMSQNQSYEFLADGLTEDVITLLARIPSFFVIARNSSFTYKGKTPDVRDVARDLGVRYVVEGSLRPVGDQLRVTVQLIDAKSGSHIWADRFDTPAESVETLQDDITMGIATRLEPELAKAEIARIERRASSNLSAWACYHQAHGLLSLKGWHRETFEEASRLLRDAIALDPNFAIAHAYLSLILALSHMFGFAPEDTSCESEAIAQAQEAMAIDSRDAIVLGYTGCAYCDLGHLGRGVELLERALESDPSNAQAWVALGTALIRAGKARKGVEMLRHGMRISPRDNRLAFWGTNLAYALFRLRQVEEAEEQALLACRRDDKLYMARVVLAIIMAHQNRMAEARQKIAEALEMRPGLSANDLRSLIGRRGIEILQKNDLLA